MSQIRNRLQMNSKLITNDKSAQNTPVTYELLTVPHGHRVAGVLGPRRKGAEVVLSSAELLPNHSPAAPDDRAEPP